MNKPLLGLALVYGIAGAIVVAGCYWTRETGDGDDTTDTLGQRVGHTRPEHRAGDPPAARGSVIREHPDTGTRTMGGG